MSAQALELALARLYTDAILRGEFLREPESALAQFDLTAAERESLLQMDRAGLVLAARSYGSKRERHVRRSSRWQQVGSKLKDWLTDIRTRGSRA
jgi:hypothetical protein